MEHNNAIAVVALDREGRLLLERQFRQAAGKELLEIPAGGIEPGEDPADAVRREMQEETGFLPQSVKLLASFYLAPGYSTEYMYLYLATGLTPSRLTAEDTDEIKLEYVRPADVPQPTSRTAPSKTAKALPPAAVPQPEVINNSTLSKKTNPPEADGTHPVFYDWPTEAVFPRSLVAIVSLPRAYPRQNKGPGILQPGPEWHMVKTGYS